MTDTEPDINDLVSWTARAVVRREQIPRRPEPPPMARHLALTLNG
jgi:hypothetical protein